MKHIFYISRLKKKAYVRLPNNKIITNINEYIDEKY